VSLRLEVFSAAAWAPEIVDRFAEAIAARPGLRLCLPTGATPRPVYHALARRRSVLATAEIFLLDEFVLPPHHPARCDAMLHRDLLDRLDVAPQAVHRLDVHAPDRAAECARYDALVAEGGLDLTLLGLGTNGHIGLNEPGSDAAAATRFVPLSEETQRRAVAYGGGEAPEWGVTLGLSAILRSRRVWLLVTGEHKAEILRRVLTGPIGAEVPASYLREHPDAVALVDEGAARLVT
jgi:glucosamine-6-phosphate deaminase